MSTSIGNVIKSIAKITAIVVLTFLFLGVIISAFYGNEVKKMMLDQLNKNLATEIKVNEFNFSVLRHFPYASFDMKQVVAKEVTDNKDKDTLLYTEHLSLLFNMMGLFRNDFTIRKIVLKNGKVNIRIDEEGNSNYHFWKSSSDSASSGIDLQKIVLDNVVISYIDQSNKQDYLLKAKSGELSGKFASDVFTLKTKADLSVYHFMVDKINYFPGKEATINSDFKINNKTNEYLFGDSRVRIAGLTFDLNGNVISLVHGTMLNLAIDAHEAELESFMNILPQEYLNYFKNFRSKGKFYFACTIKGENNANHNPEVAVQFSMKNGSITPKGSDVSLNKISATGSYRSHSVQQKSMLEIPALTAMIGGRMLKADLILEDFTNPFLTLNAEADLDLSQVRHFIKQDTLETLAGDLAFHISFAGRVKGLPRYNTDALYKVKTSGNITLKDVSFRLKKNPLEFKNINGNFSLSDNNVNVGLLKGNISSSDFQLTGVFRNFITFLIIPHQNADVDATLFSKEINLDELLTNKLSTTENDTSYKLKFNPRLVTRLNVEVGNLHFRKFTANNFKGRINLADQVITGKGLSFSAMTGTVLMDASINTSRRDSVIMSYNAKCTKLDITQLFYQMENFDQTTMTEKNVKGKISADFQFKSSWTTDLTINSKSAVSTADITIENGELNDFRPILALSKYLKLADLKHIKFSTLKNQVQIRDRKIFIPNMEIKSSALNITGSGIHDFDNIVDYKLQLLLNDILGKKVKSQDTEFGQIEDDGLGKTKLFLSMRGPVDDPKISFDKKGVADKIKTEIKNSKQNLKNILKQEFSPHRNDSLTAQKKKKEELQIDWVDK